MEKKANDKLNMIKNDVQKEYLEVWLLLEVILLVGFLNYLKGKKQSRNQSNSINKVEEYLDFCLRGSKFIIKVLDLIIHSDKQLKNK